jgi:Raf kinase inhibitor-like YbhB/YbcL family protein
MQIRISGRRAASAALGALLLATVGGTAAADGAFTLSSTSFKTGGKIAKEFSLNGYGCTGGNLSPELEWSGAPAGTKSFVITMFDPDEHGTPSGWWHWVMYNIPATAKSIPQGAGVPKSTALPAGTLQGRTDLGSLSYDGPCPDVGDPAHHYTFTIYALKVDKLDVPADASGALVTYSVHAVSLGTAKLIGRHGR